MSWLKLRTILVSMSSTKVRIVELAQTRLVLRHSSLARLKQGARSQELQLDSVSALEFEEDQLKQRLRQLEKERRAGERKFLQARREREIVENVIESQRTAYESERSRRLQMMMDDETLQRRARQRDDAI